MSYIEYSQFLEDFGSPRTEAENSERVLTKSNALKALNLLHDTDVCVLGGDVYELESDGYFRPTYDNWNCNRYGGNRETFASRSQSVAYEYLKNYKESEDMDIRYVIVIDC